MAKTRKHADRKATKSKNLVEASSKSGQKGAAPTGPHSLKTVSVDRRMSKDRRSQGDRRVANVPVVIERRKLERRAKVSRRRQIDPTTCERDYTTEEIQFMTAMDEYKRVSGRMFPTCSEILEVIRKLGYEKRASTESTPDGQHAAEAIQPDEVQLPVATGVIL